MGPGNEQRIYTRLCSLVNALTTTSPLKMRIDEAGSQLDLAGASWSPPNGGGSAVARSSESRRASVTTSNFICHTPPVDMQPRNPLRGTFELD